MKETASSRNRRKKTHVPELLKSMEMLVARSIRGLGIDAL
jgi:hypothetical protein